MKATLHWLLDRDLAEAKRKLAEQEHGTRQHDYWQGVHDALDNLRIEARQHGADD